MDPEKPSFEFRFRGYTVWVLIGNPHVQGRWLYTAYCCLEDGASELITCSVAMQVNGHNLPLLHLNFVSM